VAQAVPTYAMSIFKLPSNFTHSIQSSICNYWWGHDNGKRKVHWLSTTKLRKTKFQGGLGFRDLEAFNLAVLAKQVWRLLHANQSLVSRLLKAKYYPNCGILDAKLGPKPSFTWRSLYQAWWGVEKGSRWIVGDGWSLNTWESKWVPRPDSFKVLSPVKPEVHFLRVADLINKNNGEWLSSVVTSLFLLVDAEVIMNIPLCSSWHWDSLTWHYSSLGELTIKSAYRHIINFKEQATPGSSTALTNGF